MIFEKMAEAEASTALTPFFQAWDIEVVPRNNESSFADEQGEEEKALLEEIDIINSALHDRLERWAASFPRPGLADQLWPTIYTESERKSVRNYMLFYIEEHELVGPWMHEGAEEAAIEELQNPADFPVSMG